MRQSPEEEFVIIRVIIGSMLDSTKSPPIYLSHETRQATVAKE